MKLLFSNNNCPKLDAEIAKSTFCIIFVVIHHLSVNFQPIAYFYTNNINLDFMFLYNNYMFCIKSAQVAKVLNIASAPLVFE